MSPMNRFILSDFIKYRECPNQYTDAFIKEAEAVKISEIDNLVKVAVSSGKHTQQRAYLTEFHFPKSVHRYLLNNTDELHLQSPSFSG